jgi:hypothetical protein
MSDTKSFTGETERDDSGRAGAEPVNGDRLLRKDLVLLGDALDLITLSQGYHSPAVPPLLRTLIRDVRKLEEPQETETATDEADTATVADTVPADSADKDQDASSPEPDEPEPDTGAEAGNGATADVEAEPKPEDISALQDRVQSTDEKLATLTGAVGQLIDVLQRNAVSGVRGSSDRRHSFRVPGVNAKVFVRDRQYEVVNWSKSGFLIKAGDADRFSRRGFDFHFVLELPDEVIEFQGRATPVRIERETLAAEFADLDEATAEKMAAVADALGAGG